MNEVTEAFKQMLEGKAPGKRLLFQHYEEQSTLTALS